MTEKLAPAAEQAPEPVSDSISLLVCDLQKKRRLGTKNIDYEPLLQWALPKIRGIAKEIAGKWHDSSLQRDDVISEGKMIFMKAIDGFNPLYGPFEKYLTTGLHRGMTTIFLKDVIGNYAAPAKKIWKARKAFREVFGRDATDEELMNEYDISAEDIIDSTRRMKTVQGSIAGEEDEQGIESTWKDSSGATPNTAPDDEDETKHMSKLLKTIHKKFAEVFRLRHGISEDGLQTERKTKDEVAKILNIPKRAADTLYREAKAQLSRKLAEKNERAPAMELVQAVSVSPSFTKENTPQLQPIAIEPNAATAAEQKQEVICVPLLPVTPLTELAVVPPLERVREQSSIMRTLDGLQVSTRCACFEYLALKSNHLVPTKDLTKKVLGEVNEANHQNLVRIISWIRSELRKEGHKNGVILFDEQTTSYQFTTESWAKLATIEDLTYAEYRAFELLAEWERRPVPREALVKKLSESGPIGSPEVIQLMFNLKKKVSGIVTTHGGYLVNLGTSIPQNLLTELNYHEYVLLSTLLEHGIGTPVPRATLFASVSFAHNQTGRNPLQAQALTLAIQGVQRKMHAQKLGTVERRLREPPHKPTIVDCTLTEWNVPIAQTEPKPVISWEEANARRFAGLMSHYTNSYLSETRLMEFFGSKDVTVLLAEAQKFLPEEKDIQLKKGFGYHLQKKTADVLPQMVDTSEEILGK